MRKIIYSKYNQTRTTKYQTKTVIVKDDRDMYVEKSAVSEAAREHIDRFKSSYEGIKKLYPNIKVIDTIFDGEIVRYPYLKGRDYDSVIVDGVTGVESLLEKVKLAIEELFVVNSDNVCKFSMNDEFKEMFGDIDCADLECIKPCNLDMIFDNIMLMEDGSRVLFDYEWVFDIAIPRNFVIYRVLCHFFERHIELITSRYNFDTFMEYFGISESEVQRFLKMEAGFIKHVYNEGEPAFSSEQYPIERMPFEIANWKARDYDNLMKIYRDSEFIYKRIVRTQNERIENLQKELDEYRRAYEQVLGSKSWKMTKPLRWTRSGLASVKNNGVKKTGQIVKAKINKTGNVINTNTVEEITNNAIWYDRELFVDENTIIAQKNREFSNKVKFSIITPLFNTPEKYLRELLDSVVNQTYTNLELCLCNFGDDEHKYVEDICKEYADRDSRIVYHGGFENKGISENTNTCLAYATGDYIALLDHDDLLHVTALYYMAEEINNSGADFLYSDEIKFEEEAKYAYAPNFKPDFSAEELRVHNYICHLCVFKKSLLDEVGGYRKEFDGSQDHDIVLRLTEKAKKISHISRILYLWRVHQGSVALNINEKPYATIAGEKAVTEQLNRMGQNLRAESIINNIPCYRYVSENNDISKMAAIIWGTSKDDNYNGMKEKLVSEGMTSENIVCVCEENTDNSSINYSGAIVGELWNLGMKKLKTDWVLIIYANAKTNSDNILEKFSVYTERQDIFTVDTKVVNSSSILSGGLQLYGDFGNDLKLRCKGRDKNYPGYENAMILSREVVASLGVCTLVNKNIWNRTAKFGRNSIKAMGWLTFDAPAFGGINVWTPEIEVSIENEAVMDVYESIDVVYGQECGHKDRLLSEKVVKYGLE